MTSSPLLLHCARPLVWWDNIPGEHGWEENLIKPVENDRSCLGQRRTAMGSYSHYSELPYQTNGDLTVPPWPMQDWILSLTLTAHGCRHSSVPHVISGSVCYSWPLNDHIFEILTKTVENVVGMKIFFKEKLKTHTFLKKVCKIDQNEGSSICFDVASWNFLNSFCVFLSQ